MDFLEVKKHLDYMLDQQRIRSQLQKLNSFEECMIYDWFECVTNPLFFLFEIKNVIRLIIYLDRDTMALCLGDYLVQPRDENTDYYYGYATGINSLEEFARKADDILTDAYLWSKEECELIADVSDPQYLRDDCNLKNTDRIKSIPGLFSLTFNMINLLFDDFKDTALERLDLLDSTDNLFCEQTFLSDNILNEWDIFSGQKASNEVVILNLSSGGLYAGADFMRCFRPIEETDIKLPTYGVYAVSADLVVLHTDYRSNNSEYYILEAKNKFVTADCIYR